jgi:hypothetical protein
VYQLFNFGYLKVTGQKSFLGITINGGNVLTRKEEDMETETNINTMKALRLLLI